jgi:hypothetical protein
MRYTFIFIIFLLSCHTARKSEKAINMVQLYHPEILAKRAAQLYPCKTIKISSDSTDFINWIEQVNQIDTIVVVDSLIRVDSFVTNCPKLVTRYRQLIRKYPIIHDTITIVDESKLIAKEYELSQMTIKNESNNKKYIRCMYWIMWLFLIIICLLLAIKFKK